VKMILTRNRVDHTIFSDKVIFWALDSALDNNFNYIHPLNTTASNMVIILAKDVAVKEQALISVVCDLPGVINVKDSDELKIEVSVGSSAFASDIDSSLSYVEAEFEQFIGYEENIPVVKVFSINSGESSFSPAIGNDVVKISLINLDKDSILEADQVIQSMSLKSDKYSSYATWRQLLCRRYYEMGIPVEAAYLRQSFLLYSGNDLDGSTLDLQLNSSNVNSAKNGVVVSYLMTDLFTADRALNMQKKHAGENFRKVLNRAGVDSKHIVEKYRR
ncbi:MAG: hypothetical protein JXB49_30070, partial [Bacteroidales bacterium]|nr:hypothetical protein [Bacteroidales bacterium]